MSVTTRICLLSSPRGSEHVPGPVSGGCHQQLPVAGKFSGSQKGHERHGRDWRQLRVGMGVGEEEYALETMLTVVASVFRRVVQLHRELVQRTCMQKVPASF